MPQIEVTFDIDANGILKVTAMDKATSRSQHITITASSGLSESEIEKMRQEAEQNKDADTRRKELIEVRNHADNAVYTAEKSLRDFGDKVPADVKQKIEDKVKVVRDVMNTDNPDAIKKATEELGLEIQQLGASMYQQPGPEAPGAAEGEQPPSTDGGEDVVDGEFKNA